MAPPGALGVGAGAQPTFHSLQSASGLLVVFVGGAVQGGGDGGVAVGAGRQGQAEDRAVISLLVRKGVIQGN